MSSLADRYESEAAECVSIANQYPEGSPARDTWLDRAAQDNSRAKALSQLEQEWSVDN